MSDREKQFEQLFRENYSRLYHYALDFLGDSESARDIVSELFSDLWHRQDRYKPENDAAYLYYALRNRCLNQIKHASYVNEALKRYAEERAKFIEADISAHEEKMMRVEKAMNDLPDKTRLVLEHCYLEGMKYKEVALKMDISPGMVHKHVSKALTALRKKFRE